ncbi:hypothetical protein J6590_030796 [Homalodisca vitripennis]|nr:hypothetical protein J6590_030796 [Homalodisca vitripennis]
MSETIGGKAARPPVPHVNATIRSSRAGLSSPELFLRRWAIASTSGPVTLRGEIANRDVLEIWNGHRQLCRVRAHDRLTVSVSLKKTSTATSTAPNRRNREEFGEDTHLGGVTRNSSLDSKGKTISETGTISSGRGLRAHAHTQTHSCTHIARPCKPVPTSTRGENGGYLVTNTSQARLEFRADCETPAKP